MKAETRPLQPAAAYEHAHLIVRDMLADLLRQHDDAMRPEDRNPRWRHVHAINRLNATLSEASEAVDALNSRNR